MSISNTIELMLQNGINISGYDNITAANALLNSSTLITAIKNTILSKLNQINLNFLGVCYSAKDILAGINIELPKSISLLDALTGQISGVIMSYYGVQINTSSNPSFTIFGFSTTTKQNILNSIVSTSNNENLSRSDLILTKLAGLLKQTIAINNYSNVTAVDVLNDSSSLTISILNAIESEISSTSFIIGDINYTTNEILNDLTITLPKSISLSDALNGEISDVQISFNTNVISLSNNETNSFVISGFEAASATNIGNSIVLNSNGTTSSINQEIANILDNLLNQNINVSTYDSFNTITAADALDNSAKLNSAIINAIEAEISSPIIVAKVSYTASEIANNITVTLPSTISLIDYENSQIPNVSLNYAGILLSNSANKSTFTITGFEQLNSLSSENE
ncbi:hypothetical protein J6P52_01455 [bacterium]|nr:hypothetical protein [bacterium]